MKTSMNDVKGYQISRKPDQADDSLDSFEWQPPKESDELYEALKGAFPKGTTHRYRMRDALIDFLLQEREGERELQRISVPAVKRAAFDTQSIRSSDEDKFQQNSLRGSERRPRDTIHRGSMPPETPDEPFQVSRKKKPKDWDTMTVVWTSESGLARAPRPKRTMTEEERKDYQLRRVRGACVSCKKRKRKVQLYLKIFDWRY